MTDRNDTPATGAPAFQIDRNNVFLIHGKGKNPDFLNVKSAVADTMAEIRKNCWNLLKSAADRAEAEATNAKRQAKLETNLDAQNLNLSCRVLQAGFNAPPSGPAHELVAAYDGTGRCILASEAYERLNAHPTTNFRDLFNDESPVDVRDVPEGVKKLLDKTDADDATRERAARHSRALSYVWTQEDVERAVKKILGLTKGVVPSYEWVGKSLATGRYVHSDALLLDAGNEGKGQVRSMLDLHEAVDAWTRRRGDAGDYWNYAFPKPIYHKEKKGDAFSSVEGVKRYRDAVRTEIRGLPEEIRTKLLKFYTPLQQMGMVSDLLWNHENSRILRTIINEDGSVRLANPAFSAYLGYGAEELRGMKKGADAAFLADEASRDALAQARAALAHGEGHLWSDYLLRRADGRTVEATGHAYGLGDGKVYVQWKMDPRTYETK